MSSTSLSSPSKGLRQRMNYLSQAQSKVAQRHDHNRAESPSPSGSGSFEREEYSQSGTEEESEYEDAETSAPSPLPNLPVRERSRPPPSPDTETPWYTDPTIMPLIISSFFSWLTGGDVLRSMFLLVLSAWWLWQVREVPWRLYLSSRPRQPSPSHLSASSKTDPDPETETEPHHVYKTLAESELHSLELLFLVLTLLSPFFGAFLLRTMSSMLSGEELSWFSTTLFVMASAWRPWSHLVERVSGRVEGLHDLVHYPPLPPHSPPSSSETARLAEEKEEEMQKMQKRLADLEKSLVKLKERMNTKFEDVYDYVDESVEKVQHQLQKDKGRERPLLTTTTTRKERGAFGWVLPEWLLPSHSRPISPRVSPTNSVSPRRPSYHQHPSDRLETIFEEPASSAPPPYAQKVGFVQSVINGLTSMATFPIRVLWDLVWKVV